MSKITVCPKGLGPSFREALILSVRNQPCYHLSLSRQPQSRRNRACTQGSREYGDLTSVLLCLSFPEPRGTEARIRGV